MKCELCGKEPDTYVILPIKQPSGSLVTITCLPCAEQSPAYCRKHKAPHLGFDGDDTTACRPCIEELVNALEVNAGAICIELEVALSADVFNKIREAAAASSSITGDSEPISVLRFIVTKALRRMTSHEEVVHELLHRNSADVILR